MAKSKNGGSRAYLRGRLGADVYSIGRNAKGEKQQVVRSLAESVTNPQTLAQMRGRMIMSTVMQAVTALRPIIDHSFDNVTGKQPNISEFVARNYKLVKADVASHPATANKFGLNSYQEKGAKRGQYVISYGSAALPSVISLNQSTGVITIALDDSALTIASLKAKLGLSSEEYFTLVGITEGGDAAYERYRINPSLDDTTAISATNIAEVFAVEGNVSAVKAISGNNITLTIDSVKTCCAVIVSRKANGGYIHNQAVLGAGDGYDAPADTALPTYPVGSANFLNGGDIFGGSENSFNNGSSEEPETSSDPTLTISTSGSGSATVTVDGSNVASGSTVAAGKTINISVTPAEGKTPNATLNGSTVALTQSGSAYSGTATMPNANATLSISTGSTDGESGLE